MQQCCSAKSFNFHLRFKGFVNKIDHLLQTNEQCQYLLKKNTNSRGYIIRLGLNQHPDLNSIRKSRVTASPESELGKGPNQWAHFVGETSKLQFWDSCLKFQATNWYSHQSVSKLQLWFHVNAVCLILWALIFSRPRETGWISMAQENSKTHSLSYLWCRPAGW